MKDKDHRITALSIKIRRGRDGEVARLGRAVELLLERVLVDARIDAKRLHRWHGVGIRVLVFSTGATEAREHVD